MNIAGAGGDGDVGRAADVEGAVEVAVGGEGGCGGEGEALRQGMARTLIVLVHEISFRRPESLRFDAGRFRRCRRSMARCGVAIVSPGVPTIAEG